MEYDIIGKSLLQEKEKKYDGHWKIKRNMV